MLPPHMLRKLVLPSIPRSLAFRAVKNGAEMKLENLIETMDGSFMTDAVRVSVEGDGTAKNVAWNPRVGCGDSRSSCHKRLNYCRLNRCWNRGLSCDE